VPATPETQVLKNAVLLACRAPSVHNSQPWLWVAEGGVLRLFVDRHRTVPGTDDSGREAIISCGAVLDHLRVAMLVAGWHASIKRLPNPEDPTSWHRSNSAPLTTSPTNSATAPQRFCNAEPIGCRWVGLPTGILSNPSYAARSMTAP